MVHLIHLNLHARSRRDVEYRPADRYGLSRQDSERRVFAVPEAVAEAASYLTSLQRDRRVFTLLLIWVQGPRMSLFLISDLKTEISNQFWYSAGNIPEGGYKVERVIADHLIAKKGGCSSGDILEVLQVLDRSRQEKQTL